MGIEELSGKTLIKITNKNNKELIFLTTKGEEYRLYHYQDCCECVRIEDICGDLNDLLASPIIDAEEVTSKENPEDINKERQDSFTWTFYKLATALGFVTIRWYGESNGYYSESVNFEQLK